MRFVHHEEPGSPVAPRQQPLSACSTLHSPESSYAHATADKDRPEGSDTRYSCAAVKPAPFVHVDEMLQYSGGGLDASVAPPPSSAGGFRMLGLRPGYV
jgi:hypothetical protein